MTDTHLHSPNTDAPNENELRGAVLALGIDMTEWEDARYPADAEMLDSVVAEAIRLRNPVTNDDVRLYLRGLQPGERVVNTGMDAFHKRQGDVYMSKTEGHGLCILFDPDREGEGRYGSSVTWTARRLSDVDPEFLIREPIAPRGPDPIDQLKLAVGAYAVESSMADGKAVWINTAASTGMTDGRFRVRLSGHGLDEEDAWDEWWYDIITHIRAEPETHFAVGDGEDTVFYTVTQRGLTPAKFDIANGTFSQRLEGEPSFVDS